LMLGIGCILAAGVRSTIGQGATSPRESDADDAGTPITEIEPSETPADEARIAELIEQMGDDRYAVREAAQEKLVALGPESVPALQRHRNHKDPEVRLRVREIIKRHAHLEQGAIILRVNSDSPAERLNMKVGDVVVRIDETNITDKHGLSEYGFPPRTYLVWRDGALLEIESGEGPVGIRLGDWRLDRGGADHARGLAAVVDPDRWGEAPSGVPVRIRKPSRSRASNSSTTIYRWQTWSPRPC